MNCWRWLDSVQRSVELRRSIKGVREQGGQQVRASIQNGEERWYLSCKWWGWGTYLVVEAELVCDGEADTKLVANKTTSVN
jgi:hypothetical protein